MKAVLILFTLLSLNSFALDYYVIERSSVPLQIHDDSKSPGIITEVLQKCLSKSYKTYSYPFSRLIKELTSTKNDWINFGSPSWSGVQSKNLSREAILSTRHYLIALKSSGIKSLKDVGKKKIVLIKGFAYPGLEELIKKNKITVFYVKDIPSALRAIELGRGDIFPEMDFRLFYHINKSKLKVKSLDFIDLTSFIPETTIHFSYSKDFPVVQKKSLDKCLANLKRTGQIAHIKRKYNFESISFLRAY